MSRDQRAVLIELTVIQAQAGEADAVERLVELLQPELTAFAARIISDSEAARDVVQDTWIAVLKSLGRLTDPAAFRSWILRVVHNKSIDRLRTAVRERRELETLGRSRTLDYVANSTSPADNLANVKRLIDSLTTADKTVLILFYENELTIREIAEITGKSESATKSQLYHIRQRLKDQLTHLERKTHVEFEQH